MPVFVLHDTYLDAMASLPNEEAGLAGKFIQSFKDNPKNPSHRLERVDRRPGEGLWSARVSRDLRAILYKGEDLWAFLWVDHHDPAYRWAERREVGRHPVTGALQVAETVEEVRKVVREVEVPAEVAAKPLLEARADDYLLSLGFPPDWIPLLRELRTEDQLLAAAVKLPEPLAERLLELGGGRLPTPPAPVDARQSTLQSADTQRRFYVLASDEELRKVLEAPLEKWIAFLHPSQRAMAYGDFSGPLKVTGSAGTGKTVVAIHRARHLARQGKRVLLTSFVTTLCQNLQHNVELLCTDEERSHITVSTVHKQALAAARCVSPGISPPAEGDIAAILDEAIGRTPRGFSEAFIRAEWEHVIQAQGTVSWEEYREAIRVGRERPLGLRERRALWDVFGEVFRTLEQHGKIDWAGLSRRGLQALESGSAPKPFDAVIVDEVQDLKAPDLLFVRALCTDSNQLTLVGDAGQRIYPGGFSLRALGIEVRGRSRVLRINYRTTEQIRRAADQLLGGEGDNLDGGLEARATRSLLQGPQPTFVGAASAADEARATVDQIRDWLGSGIAASEMAVFARTGRRLDDVAKLLKENQIASHRLSNDETPPFGSVRLGTMHRAKGLEFKAVQVIDCSARALPHPKALQNLEDPTDRKDAEDRERRLLYVAMTRARDELTVRWSGPPSPFLETILTHEGRLDESHT
ncbi:MAG: 3'-5' exonuclease [bacterium]